MTNGATLYPVLHRKWLGKMGEESKLKSYQLLKDPVLLREFRKEFNGNGSKIEMNIKIWTNLVIIIKI